MKKITKYLMVMAVAAMPFAFTSCDDDDYWYDDDYGYWPGYYDDGDYYDDEATVYDEADVLAGEWSGTMEYYNSSEKQTYTYDADFIFTKNSNNAAKGTGVEIDNAYDEKGELVDTQTLQFNWEIDNNYNIYITYASGNSFGTDINSRNRGFYLSDEEGSFKGYFLGENTDDYMYFDFQRVNSKAKANTRAAGKTVKKAFGNSYIEKPVAEKLIKGFPVK